MAGTRSPTPSASTTSDFDAAAFPDSRLLLVADAKGPEFHADMPYRCLLPKGLDGLLVVGLGASAERDAMTLVRMQADLQNQGYAAGTAAAEAARIGGRARAIDIKALQKTLSGEGVLEARVVADKDSFPLGPQDLQRAVTDLEAAEPGARLAAWLQSCRTPSKRFPCSTSLRRLSARRPATNLCHAPRGPRRTGRRAALIAAVDGREAWDRGSALTAQRKTGNTYSELDRLVIALGLSRAPAGLPALLRKLRQLRPESRLSHYKAIAAALWHSRSPEAAKPLAGLLAQPGFGGHATLEPIVRHNGSHAAAPGSAW